MTTLQYPDKIIPGSDFEKTMAELTPDEFQKLQEKLRTAQMVLALSSKRGGAPFVYIFSSTKEHVLADFSNELYVDDQGNKVTHGTAATNGKTYFWHPDILKRLTATELAVVQMHETFHTVFQHCDINRSIGKNKKLWNIAVDYIVHCTIEHDFRKAGYISDYSSNSEGHEHQLWKSGLHKPLLFKDLLNAITQEAADVKSGKVTKGKKKKREIVKEEDLRCYADYSLYGKSAEDIYNELEKASQDLTDELLQQLLDGLGAGDGDQHIPGAIDKNDLLSEILSSLQYAKSMGNMPSSLEDQLAKLLEPRLSWSDLVRKSFQRFRKDKGNVKDWSRFNRRDVSYGNYRPKYKDPNCRFLAFLDTSGSMSDDDMAYAVSQLKALDSRATGVLVPNDAAPHWKGAIDIYSAKDLTKTKCIGRGGTAFKEIFDDYPKKVGRDFDVIIVLTDGGIFDMNEIKKPKGVDVVWVLCNNDTSFNPPFGLVAPLRSY